MSQETLVYIAFTEASLSGKHGFRRDPYFLKGFEDWALKKHRCGIADGFSDGNADKPGNFSPPQSEGMYHVFVD